MGLQLLISYGFYDDDLPQTSLQGGEQVHSSSSTSNGSEVMQIIPVESIAVAGRREFIISKNKKKEQSVLLSSSSKDGKGEMRVEGDDALAFRNQR